MFVITEKFNKMEAEFFRMQNSAPESQVLCLCSAIMDLLNMQSSGCTIQAGEPALGFGWS